MAELLLQHLVLTLVPSGAEAGAILPVVTSMSLPYMDLPFLGLVAR